MAASEIIKGLSGDNRAFSPNTTQILTSLARPFALPEEAEDARRVVAELPSTAKRVVEVHTFGKAWESPRPKSASTGPPRPCAHRVPTSQARLRPSPGASARG